MHKLLRGSLIALVCLFAIYLVLAIHYWSGSRIISVDYIARAQEAQPVGPDEERSWPTIRDAIYQLSEGVAGSDGAALDAPLSCRDESHPDWLTAWRLVGDNAKPIAALRDAAGRQRVGFRFQHPLETEDLRLLPDLAMTPRSPEGMLMGVMLPHLAQYRLAARWLEADAIHAAAGSRSVVGGDGVDGERAARDIAAMFGLGRQLLSPGSTLIQQLVGTAVLLQGQSALAQVLRRWPAALSDGDLKALAESLAVVNRTNLTMDLSSERMLFYDTVQRIYTDDGSGDGRLCGAGWGELVPMFEVATNTGDGAVPIGSRLLAPAIAVIAPSRRQLIEKYDSYMDRSEMMARTPFREWQARGLGETDLMSDLRSGWLDSQRWYLVNLLVPAVSSAGLRMQNAETMRQCALAAIAVERYHRKHLRLPDTLDELVPEFMASVPVDPHSGGEVRLASNDNRGIKIYGVGPDGVDGGGGSLDAIYFAAPDALTP